MTRGFCALCVVLLMGMVRCLGAGRLLLYGLRHSRRVQGNTLEVKHNNLLRSGEELDQLFV